MKTFKILSAIVFFIFAFIACNKDENSLPTNGGIVDINQLSVNSNFDYKTTSEVSFTFTALDNQNGPLKSIRFNIYTANPDSGGVFLSSGATNNYGNYSGTIVLPSYQNTIYISTDYIGLPSQTIISISGSSINHTFGGKQVSTKISNNTIQPKSIKTVGAVINYLGSFNSNGVPSYLEIYNDYIDANLLNDVNASLPERRPVPQYNPEYLEQGNQTTLLVTQEADVWITFVHEGAGNKNSLGFYTYDAANPPQTAADIDTLHIVFPNVSFYNSGGGLYSGNKVNIGRFQANTKIGWVLFQNGFIGSSVSSSVTRFYSDKWLNPETLESNKQHNVLIMDQGRNLVLLGFEDLNRNSGSDNDFNDAVFYISSNPVEAVSYSSMPTIKYTQVDTDNDGIADLFDDYPSDPKKAFKSFFPGETSYGSLAFEDLWPSKGDYDFNDLVVDYRFTQITNAANEVVQLDGSFYSKAAGASFHNGFGFQIPLLASGAIQSVTGSNLTDSYISLNSSGAEAGQSKATIIVFDDAWNNFSNIAGSNPVNSAGINTSIGGAKGDPDTINISISLVNPINSSVLGLPPYNPFMIVNKVRGREVHLPDFPPTDLANQALFGTGNDDSNPVTGRYYKSANNLPWALNIVSTNVLNSAKNGFLKNIKMLVPTNSSFDYTIEKEQITQGYLYFGNWVNTSGALYKDWYNDNTGYRNYSKIYVP